MQNVYKARAQIIELANRAMAAYPQYAGHFDAYVLVRIRREVKTKGGVAFLAGELAIARDVPHLSTNVRGKTSAFRTVWSLSNNCDTSVRELDVEPV